MMSYPKVFHFWGDKNIFSPQMACWGTLSVLAFGVSVSQSVRHTIVFQPFSAISGDIDLKFDIWICLDIIQIMFEFCHA